MQLYCTSKINDRIFQQIHRFQVLLCLLDFMLLYSNKGFVIQCVLYKFFYVFASRFKLDILEIICIVQRLQSRFPSFFLQFFNKRDILCLLSSQSSCRAFVIYRERYDPHKILGIQILTFVFTRKAHAT